MSIFVSVASLSERSTQATAQAVYESNAKARAEHLRKKNRIRPPVARERCCSCGFKIRGKNHEDGVHHKQGRVKATTRGHSTGK